jgi:hypothetical protein
MGCLNPIVRRSAAPHTARPCTQVPTELISLISSQLFCGVQFRTRPTPDDTSYNDVAKMRPAYDTHGGTDDLKSRRDCACTRGTVEMQPDQIINYSTYRMTDDQHAAGEITFQNRTASESAVSFHGHVKRPLTRRDKLMIPSWGQSVSIGHKALCM